MKRKLLVGMIVILMATAVPVQTSAGVDETMDTEDAVDTTDETNVDARQDLASFLEEASSGDPVPSRVVIGFEGHLPHSPPAYVEEAGGAVETVAGSLGFIVVSVDPDRSNELIDRALADDRVAYAELDRVVKAQYNPNDVLSRSGDFAINLHEAWDVTLGSHDVDLHVLDTGIDHSHLDLVDNLSPVCKGLTSPGATGMTTVTAAPGGQETGFHGTHVAGIAGAVIDNTIGVPGTSQSCLTSVQVLAARSGLSSWVAEGVEWSTNNGADIVSLSLGSESPSAVLGHAVSYAESNGVLVVAAAGNDDCGSVNYPAAYDDVMAVGAGIWVRASFSNCGPELSLIAPGSNIWSTLPGNTYGSLDGTSMATPYVSGTAGLVMDANASLSHTQVRCILTATAFDIYSTGHDDKSGWGLLDAEAAVNGALDPSTVNTSRGECPSGTFGGGSGDNSLVFDPGHAYVDTDNDAIFDPAVDMALPDEVVHDGTYALADASDGLVIPPSVGTIEAETIDFASGEQGHLVVAVDLVASQDVSLEGGSLLDVADIQVTSNHRVNLDANGTLDAAQAAVTANQALRVHAGDVVRVDDAELVSEDQRVRVHADTDLQATGTTVQALEPVDFNAGGDLVAKGATLSSENGKVDISTGGSVVLG